METDAMVGRVLDALEKNEVADNTLVVFTSDNGCNYQIGVANLEKQGHYPSAQFRGYKSDIWDGGHRIPFMIRWPGVIKPGSTCGQLASLVDLMGTCAEITGAKIAPNAGEDTMSMLPLLKGDDKPVRQTAVHHSWYGKFAIRDKRWKLVLAPGSGGWNPPTDSAAIKQGLPPIQLYDMEADESETQNLQAEKPEVVERLLTELKKQVAQGRTTPGSPQKNDVPVDIWKNPKTSKPATAPTGKEG
jgi:arylsulfatase A-like enzyme